MTDRLIFDTTDATSIAASANVGSYIRAGDDGTQIGHVSDALKVNFSNTTIAVTATNLDIRDLVFATDKVDVGGSVVALDSTTLAALESITVQNGAGAAAVNIQDGGNSITVDAVNLDIRDLAAATDSVSSWTKDGSGTSITSRAEGGGQALDVHITGSGALTINDAALANTAIASARSLLTLLNVAENIIASPLANRKYVWLYNNDNRVMFVGQSGVSATTGFPISPGSYMELRAGASVDIEWVSSKTAHDMRTLELS